MYYRLAVIPISIPPLRERRPDILPLLRGAVAEFAADFGRVVGGIDPIAEVESESYDWPGNVRELRNRAERAVALLNGHLVQMTDLFPEAFPRPMEELLPTLAAVRLAAENRHIVRALEATGGQIEEAAKRLGISRSAMFERLKRQRLSP